MKGAYDALFNAIRRHTHKDGTPQAERDGKFPCLNECAETVPRKTRGKTGAIRSFLFIEACEAIGFLITSKHQRAKE